MPIQTVSIVIPVFNSADGLHLLVERIEKAISLTALNAEVILVNDGSRDQSWSRITEASSRNPRIRGINLMRNYGQHNAVLCGIRAACHETIVTMDDDLQNPPEEIPKLLQLLDEGYDVAYGTPEHEQHGFWRDLASKVTKLALQNAMGAETARRVSAFRAFRTQLRAAFANYCGAFVSIDVLLTWATTRFTAVPVRHDARRYGESAYTFMRLLIHALNMMTGFSVVPLQAASWIGFLSTVFGVIVFGWVVGRFLIQGGSVPGFTFLAAIIAIFSGAQLFALGVIGEYLARMHFRIMDKPAYVIRETIAITSGIPAGPNG